MINPLPTIMECAQDGCEREGLSWTELAPHANVWLCQGCRDARQVEFCLGMADDEPPPVDGRLWR